MEIIDAQVHVVEGLDASAWADRLAPSAAVTPASMLERMDAVGVGSALATTSTFLGRDNTAVVDAVRHDPLRFGAIGAVAADHPELDETLRLWRPEYGMLGVRIVVITPAQRAQWFSNSWEPLFAAAERHGVPVCIFPPGLLEDIPPVARAHPNLQLVVDHLGLAQPTRFSQPDADPFRALPDLLRLAALPNVAVKLTGATALSRQRFPFTDLWPHLHDVLSAFGLERVMWGSDWTRITTCSYAECVDYIRSTSELAPADKEMILGRALRRLFRWPAGTRSSPD